jgi:FkbM family methyltransferase
MLKRIVRTVADRWSATSAAKRDLLNTALDHMEDVAYTRLRNAGFVPAQIIDVGACSGRWSRDVREIFPDAPLVMIEARAKEEERLRATALQLGNARYEICLLGAAPSDAVSFSISGFGSSIFPERSNAAKVETTLPMRTLDDVAEPKSPTFLKIDAQGAELEILKGGSKTLEACEIVQLETALLPYNEGAPTAAEVVSFMDQRGFAIFDVAEFIRPMDKHLTHLDFIFASKTSRLRPDSFSF